MLLNLNDFRRAANAVAAGTGDTQAGLTIDTHGYATVVLVGIVGTITASGTCKIKAQHGDASDASDMADIAGSGVDLADSDDNKMAAIEIHEPKKRYVRLAFVRATANVVIDGGVAVLAHARVSPPPTHSTVDGVKTLISPSSGTA